MRKPILLMLSCFLLPFTLATAFAQGQGGTFNIHIRDYCDPASFDAVLGPGACVRDTAIGAITFGGFIGEITVDKSAGAWRFAPDQLKAAEGATLNIQSLGGETHTFTRVKRFGGGFVAVLNGLSGNPTPAPECAQMVGGNLVPQPPGPDNLFIPAGGSASATLKEGQVTRFQCCIHPWMRLTVTPRDQHHTQVQ